ncbi:phosphate acyltransferase [Pseudorhodobacter turbinis]|uniref:phosphate acyltransferase n=1 Tax=Pseudorhodobacter turbinis TaxID=2500533 RepID=UPI0023F09D11|nr:phosphate acyltransferase [Pseudorhodobacter turbinis]
MNPLNRILAAARSRQRHIILPEGDNPLVTEAARKIVADEIAKITLMNGPDIPGVISLTPSEAPDLPYLAQEGHQMRVAKGMTAHQALSDMKDPIMQAAIRVRLDLADGTVGGAAARTAETVRAVLRHVS